MQLAQRNSSIPLQTAPLKCRLCQCLLNSAAENQAKALARRDDLHNLICADCKQRPEAKITGLRSSDAKQSRPFTPADKSLVSKVRSFMLPTQILALLNERLLNDLGPGAVMYTLDNLQPLLNDFPTAAAGDDWASLRQTLATAKREGTLTLIDWQCLDDFAIVYSLSAGQLSRLKDVFGPIVDERKHVDAKEGAQ